MVSTELIWNALNYISEEMGIALRNTAYSPNIRDRLDHSCAILSSEAELIAQAEHIPVHIGSMAIGLENTIEYLEKEGVELNEGDVIIVNNPYIAGTHLNDITLVKPVFYKNRLVAYIANKAHHVDVGGKVPGSIGGDVKSIHEEGIVIDPTKLVESGEINNEFVKDLISKVRTPRYLKGDLYAQLASLNTGHKRLIELIDRYGLEDFLNSVEASLDYTEKYLLNRLRNLGVYGYYQAEDSLEGYGQELLKINVNIKIDRKGIVVDFTGSSKEVEYPLNAVYGVTVAASTYAIKSAVEPDLPINHGIYRVLEIIAERGSILNPTYPHPVSGGNLETSQRIVDVIHKALAEAYPDHIPAASCGSMNNIMIGGEGWAFYETIGGGSGARPKMDGIDGIHTNMTNTLNTPIEILEREYPIIFVKYEFRKDSSGPGRYRGGLGLTRAFKLLSRATLTIMADRVRVAPYGLRGGGPGAKGFHYIIKRNGKKILLPSKLTISLEEGDIVYINTPGGGGYGDPNERRVEYILRDLEDDKITEKYILEYHPTQYNLIKDMMLSHKIEH